MVLQQVITHVHGVHTDLISYCIGMTSSRPHLCKVKTPCFLKAARKETKPLFIPFTQRACFVSLTLIFLNYWMTAPHATYSFAHLFQTCMPCLPPSNTPQQGFSSVTTCQGTLIPTLASFDPSTFFSRSFISLWGPCYI